MMTEETVLAQWDEYKKICTLESKVFINSIGGKKAVDTELGGGHKVRLVHTRIPYQRPWA